MYVCMFVCMCACVWFYEYINNALRMFRYLFIQQYLKFPPKLDSAVPMPDDG